MLRNGERHVVSTRVGDSPRDFHSRTRRNVAEINHHNAVAAGASVGGSSRARGTAACEQHPHVGVSVNPLANLEAHHTSVTRVQWASCAVHSTVQGLTSHTW